MKNSLIILSLLVAAASIQFARSRGVLNHNTAACAVEKRSSIDLNPNTAGKYQPFTIKKFNSYNYL